MKRARKSDRIYAEEYIDGAFYGIKVEFRNPKQAKEFFSLLVDKYEMNAIAEWHSDKGGYWLETDTKWAKKHEQEAFFNKDGTLKKEFA